jgi:hypothetical protein
MSGTLVRRWREWSGSGLQHLVLREEPEKRVAEAAVLVTEDALFAAHYRIVTVLGDDRRLLLESDGSGHWRDGQGRALPDLDGAFDVDLPITPFTNTLPIRRLALGAGQSADLKVVYILLPAFEITTDPQRYVCLQAGRRYRYESLDSDFVRELEVDAEGLVIDYPGLFKRV